MEITGKTFINKGEYGFYTTIKDRQGAKVFLTVGFRRDEEPEAGGEFNLKHGFLSAYKTRKGEDKLKLVVMSYEQVAESQGDSRPTPKLTEISNTDELGELPF